MKQFVDDITVNTIVGEGSFISGNINSVGFTKIDGDVKGNIASKGRVVISQNARVQGNVRGTSVVVGGVINGDIIAPMGVQLSASAVVLGAIVTRHLIMEDGVLFSGFCYAVDNAQGFEEAESAYKNKRVVASTASRH